MKAAKYIIIGILLVGGGLFFLLSYQQDKNRRMREEAAALETARQSAQRYQSAIQTLAQSVFEVETEARAQAQKATNAVRVVTGTPFTRRPASRYLPSRPTRAPTPPPTEEKKDDASAKGAPEDEMPPGMLSREQLDRMRAAAQARQGEKAKATPEPAAPPSSSSLPLPGDDETPTAAETEAAPAADVPKEPEIAILARTVVSETETIVENASRLRGMRQSAASLADQVTAAHESRTAAGRAAELKALHDVALILKDEVEASMDALQEPLKNVLQAEASHAIEEERRREARARLLEEEGQRKRTQQELARVGTLHTRARELAKTLSFNQAVEEIRAGAEALQTPAAQKAAAVLRERYERLQALHVFLIQRINVKRYRWGWGQGPSAKDVVAANERVLQVTGMRVPWEEVALPQMIRLLRYYVDDTDLDRRERARQQLALAIFYAENELDDLAASLTADLRRRHPTLHDDIDRLLQ